MSLCLVIIFPWLRQSSSCQHSIHQCSIPFEGNHLEAQCLLGNSVHLSPESLAYLIFLLTSSHRAPVPAKSYSAMHSIQDAVYMTKCTAIA